MNRGLSYLAVTWQIAVEAIVPLNGVAGHAIGGEECNCCCSSTIWPVIVWQAVEPLMSIDSVMCWSLMCAAPIAR
jgi:hypothetical protein